MEPPYMKMTDRNFKGRQEKIRKISINIAENILNLIYFNLKSEKKYL